MGDPEADRQKAIAGMYFTGTLEAMAHSLANGRVQLFERCSKDTS